MAFSLLDVGTQFVSAVGQDPSGDFILKEAGAKLPTTSISRLVGTPTASYCSVLDANGEVRLGMGDMAAHQRIDKRAVEAAFGDTSPNLIVFDGNLGVEAMDAILTQAKSLKAAVLFEPTNMLKAHLPLMTPTRDVITHTSPNLAELKAMAHFVRCQQPLNNNSPAPADTDKVLHEALTDCRTLFEATKLEMIVVTLGERGVAIAMRDGTLTFYEAEAVDDVTSVSGAGDCFISAFMTALVVRGVGQEAAVAAGFEAARCSLASYLPVPSSVSDITWNGSIAGKRVA